MCTTAAHFVVSGLQLTFVGYVCHLSFAFATYSSGLQGVLFPIPGTSHVDAEFADICDAVSATQRIKHKTRLLLKKKHAPQLVRATPLNKTSFTFDLAAATG